MQTYNKSEITQTSVMRVWGMQTHQDKVNVLYNESPTHKEPFWAHTPSPCDNSMKHEREAITLTTENWKTLQTHVENVMTHTMPTHKETEPLWAHNEALLTTTWNTREMSCTMSRQHIRKQNHSGHTTRPCIYHTPSPCDNNMKHEREAIMLTTENWKTLQTHVENVMTHKMPTLWAHNKALKNRERRTWKHHEKVMSTTALGTQQQQQHVQERITHIPNRNNPRRRTWDTSTVQLNYKHMCVKQWERKTKRTHFNDDRNRNVR